MFIELIGASWPEKMLNRPYVSLDGRCFIDEEGKQWGFRLTNNIHTPWRAKVVEISLEKIL